MSHDGMPPGPQFFLTSNVRLCSLLEQLLQPFYVLMDGLLAPVSPQPVGIGGP
ncbi:hypothetical protein FRC10_006051, partial [Ceratobasidium sp. 414]